MAYTKENLVSDIAARANISQPAALAALDALTDIVLERARAGEETRLHKFGVFSARHKKARRGRNPQTGQAVLIEAKTTLGFTPSKSANETLA